LRTTLKKGSSRGFLAGATPTDGDGAASTGPPKPPPISPVSRYGDGGHRRLRVTGKLFLWLLVTVLVAAGAFGGGIWLYLEESAAAVEGRSAVLQTEIEEEIASSGDEVIAIPEPGKATTFLVIGYDARAGETADPSRSDTIMLIRADPQKDTLTMLSFPRDLWVDHPGCRRYQHTWTDRINTAYFLGGPVCVATTVKQLTGIAPNYLVTVNFAGFKKLVNKVDGVYIDVDQRYYNPTGGVYARINLQPGYQKLTGGAALDFARYRHTDGDFHRNARQQEFVKAFKQAVSENFTLTKLPGIIKTLADSVIVGRGRGQGFDLETILPYARFLYELPSGSFYQARLSQSDAISAGEAVFTFSAEALQEVIGDFLNPDTKASEKATSSATNQKPETATPLPRDTTIEVLNGNGEDFSAATAAELLRQRGYAAESIGDAVDEAGNPKSDYFETLIRYNPDIEGSAAAALALGKLFGDYSTEEVLPDDPIDTMLQVIVGKTFHGTLAITADDETPEHQEAAVVRDFDDILPLVEGARGQVSFKPLVPLFREQGSSLSTSVPLRVYRVNGHDAIKIVYRTPGNGYWGIMQTSWTDAPILSGENQIRRLGGREMRLYFSGAKIEMIAFEESDAVFWVSNTLLNELSNETMIAIAKGLKPVTAAK
jgi:LCP family protein required for cell wall assembly